MHIAYLKNTAEVKNINSNSIDIFIQYDELQCNINRLTLTDTYIFNTILFKILYSKITKGIQ